MYIYAFKCWLPVYISRSFLKSYSFIHSLYRLSSRYYILSREKKYAVLQSMTLNCVCVAHQVENYQLAKFKAIRWFVPSSTFIVSILWSFFNRLCGVADGKMVLQQQLEKRWSISTVTFQDSAPAQSTCSLKVCTFRKK